MRIGNIKETIGLLQDAEQSETLLISEGVRLERIVSFGHPSPEGYWYDQDDSEWVFLVEGEASLEFDDRSVTLRAGDYLLIPAYCRHRVAAVSDDAIWLGLFVAGKDER